MSCALEAAEVEVVFEDEDEPEDGSGQEQGIDAVEDAAVAWKDGAGVFDACAAFDGGFEEVSKLGGDVEDCGQEEGLPDGLGDVKEGVATCGESVGDVNDQTG